MGSQVQHIFQSFPRSFDRERVPVQRDELARPVEHPGNLRVIVVRVMVKEEKLFDPGEERQCHHVIHAAVTPANVRLVFHVLVLRINDQHVGVPDELDNLLILFAGIFEGCDVV